MELDAHQHDNRANWDDRVAVHVESDMYDLDRYRNDPDHIGGTVTFDAPRLGDIAGRSVVHLQCHIGTDTISLARLGAEVTGLDFSEKAIAAARELSVSSGTRATFVVGNVYNAVETLNATFDLVYTGVGALNWLDDLDRWANAVAGLLSRGGSLYLREGHPTLFVWEEVDGRVIPYYDYFRHADEPLTFDTAETYTDGDTARITHTRTHEWNHSIPDVVNALLSHGMTIDRLEEHEGLEWALTPSWVLEGGQYFPPEGLRGKVPQMYSLWASKR